MKALGSGKTKSLYVFYKVKDLKKWSKSKYYPSVDWIYVNLNSKCYAFGMPGIPVTTPFGNHAITIDEFKVIYEIYRKNKDKAVLYFD